MFYGPNNNLFIAYEFLDFDLSHIMQKKDITFTEDIIKGLMRQFLNGLDEIHKFNVIHRDLKPENLLLKRNGILKIADFGFARFIASPGREMTTGVISEWYRPPEIFFGAQYYSYSVDMWSVGCIFAEFLLKEPLFRGQGERDILTKIFYLLGVPNVLIIVMLGYSMARCNAAKSL
jgi:cyclin-dependent kinase 7